MHRSTTHRTTLFGREVSTALALASIIAVCMLLALATPAAAQPAADTSGSAPGRAAIQETTPEATETPDGGDKIVIERPVPSAGQTTAFAIIALLFALLALGAVLLYNYGIQSRFYAVSESLSRAGKVVKAVAAPSPLPTMRTEESFRSAGEQEEPQAPAPAVTIDGPGVLTVGAQSTEFKATIDGKAADTAAWTVEPANTAIVIPATGAAVKVVAATAGTFTLSAAVAGPPDASGSVQIAAIAPQNVATELPFVGGGYGSIIIAITLLATVIVLGLAGVLSGEAVATLLGGLLGYIFGVGVSAGAKKPEGQAG